MPRARLLKPGFFTNELLAELPYEGRLLFAGLWLLADKAGRLEDRPRRIKASLFPWDEVDVQALLVALESKGFIDRYMSSGMPLIQVAKFAEHQTPHAREAESILPGPHNSLANTDDGKRLLPTRQRSPVAVTGNGSSSVPIAVDSSTALTRAEPPPVLSFPVVGLGLKRWDLVEAQIAEWAAAFPNVDIKAEARKALAWVDANPGRRKTDRGMRAFLVNWLNRAANQGGAKVSHTPQGYVPRERPEWVCPHQPHCNHPRGCQTLVDLAEAKRRRA